MSNPTADAAKLLPCPFCLSTDIDPTGWASKTESGPECLGCGATAVSAEIWNTRPQPAPVEDAFDKLEAILDNPPEPNEELKKLMQSPSIFTPPEGEPDVALRVMQLICSNPDRFQTVEGCKEIVSVVLGLATRPKVEDAVEVDLQRVKDISRLTVERDEAREKLAEREAELARVDGFLMLGWSIDAALDENPYDSIGDIAREAQKRHAAHQQQKGKPNDGSGSV